MDNKQRLGNILDGRMKITSAAATSVPVELGTINSNLSLTTDSLRGAIPKGQYMIDSRLCCDTYNTSNTTHSHSGGSHGGHESGSGTHTHDGGAHAHRLPSNFRELKAGDRVLVVWSGNEAIVVAIVVAS